MTAPSRSRPAWLDPQHALWALLVFVVLAPLARYLHWGDVTVFAFAGLAIIPLAGIMGESTEKLATRFGAGVGGLLNATFGNAAELIIALAAMQRGLYDVVKASLTGSIVGNVLLVLGASFFAGGLRRERQTFDRSAASASSTLLALAAIGLVIPALFHFVTHTAVVDQRLDPLRERALERGLSVEIAGVLFIAYFANLLFSLRTHRHLYAGAGHEPGHDESHPPLWQPLLTLLVATALVAWMSELLVGAVEAASHALHLTPLFVGVIVVAVIGNAAEHSTAVISATKNQMDLAYNIAVGSSLQIALFVAPVLLFLSYAIAPAPMDLLFTTYELVAIALSVLSISFIAHDGETHWMEGVQLLAVYAILALGFFFLPGR